MELFDGVILAFALVASPIVIAVVEALKRAFAFDDRYAPLVSVGVGISIGAAFVAPGMTDVTWTQLPIAGATTGLMASGLYSGVRATAGRS